MNVTGKQWVLPTADFLLILALLSFRSILRYLWLAQWNSTSLCKITLRGNSERAGIIFLKQKC